MKISFYYKTKEEYTRTKDLVREINGAAKSRQWGSSNTVSITTKHMDSNGTFNTNIPKSRAANKKYIGVIRGNKHVLDENGIDVHAMLNKIDIDTVSKIPSPVKYDGETTSCEFKLTGFTQFRTLTSVFNKRFGCGNWNVKGPKSLQKVLKNYEGSEEKSNTVTLGVGNAGSYYRKKYPKGVEVILTVNEPDANIEKHLFKVKLKV